MKIIIKFFIIFISLASYASEIKPAKLFDADSYQAILEDKKSQAFIVVLWSLDCSPCMKELDMLGGISKRYPDINMIFISTDESSEADEIMQLMTKYKLNSFQQWVFSADLGQSLRYSIDPAWYGELPRSYFHTQDGKRHAVTGGIKSDHIKNWYQTL